MANRHGIRANLMVDLYRWVRREEMRMRTSKTILTTAAFVALRLVGTEERDSLGQWAKVIDDGVISWADFERLAGKTSKERAKALKECWETELSRKLEEVAEDSAKRA